MSHSPQNRLVVIGPTGCRKAYLNVDRDEAVRRYMADDVAFPGDQPTPPRDDEITEFAFSDSFSVYDAGPGA